MLRGRWGGMELGHGGGEGKPGGGRVAATGESGTAIGAWRRAWKSKGAGRLISRDFAAQSHWDEDSP